MKRKVCFVVIIAYCWVLGACSISQQMPLTKVAQQLEGSWINQEYLEILEETKSAQKAAEVTTIKIVQIKIDSFEQLVLSFEEGDDWILGRDGDGLFFSNIFDYKLQLKATLISNKKLQLGNKLFFRFKEEN
jgi:hypothetical protein